MISKFFTSNKSFICFVCVKRPLFMLFWEGFWLELNFCMRDSFWKVPNAFKISFAVLIISGK